MAEVIIPKIDEENYEAFRKLLGDGMPATHADWLRDRGEEIARSKSFGYTSREVAIYPDEVTKFRAGRDPVADPMRTLQGFCLKDP